MKQYLDLLRYVLANGKHRLVDAQGVGNIAVLGYQMRFSLADGNGFPLLTTKRIPFRFVVGELIWFLRGERRVDFLRKNNITIWDPWATKEACERYGLEEGDLGRIYGPQWIHWLKRDGGEINQIANLVESLKKDPNSKRHMVTAWNPEDVDGVFVAPCHGIFKCFVVDGVLSLHLFQRSADVFIGVPFNIASYSLLLLMLAQVTGLKTGEFVHTTSDTHIYLNHVDQVKLQLSREPRPLPRIRLNAEVKDIFKFTFDDFRLEDYDPYPHISAPVGI
ncbi:MAG: thymidylate synthase [bacterium]|nr:thymidylate synthase [bacterium]